MGDDHVDKEDAIEAVRHPLGRAVRNRLRGPILGGAADEFYEDMLRGRWRDFPNGKRAGASGGDRAAAERYAGPHALLRIVLERARNGPAGPAISATVSALRSASFTPARSIGVAASRPRRARGGWQGPNQDRDLLDRSLAPRHRPRPEHRTARHRPDL